MSWKEFLKPAPHQVFLSFLFSIAFFLVGVFCAPLHVDYVGIRYTCGWFSKVLARIAFEPLFLFFACIFAFFYLLISVINYFRNN